MTDEAAAFTTRRMRIGRVKQPESAQVGERAPAFVTARSPATDSRPMNVVVCVKQIPDPAVPGALDPDTNTLNRDGKLILDESDSYGVEMALQLVDKAGGGEVTLVSMAPNSEVSGLRTALAMGAAKAILVSDDALAGLRRAGDRQGARQGVERAGERRPRPHRDRVDRRLHRHRPAQVAELLGWPSLTFAKHDRDRRTASVKVQRQTEAGYDEVEAPLPAVVSVTAGVVEPRYPSFKGIMAAKNKPVDQVTVADLGLDADDGRLGRRRPGDRRRRRSAEPARPARRSKTTARRYEKVVAFLEQLKVI